MSSSSYIGLAKAAAVGAVFLGSLTLASLPAQANTITLSDADLQNFTVQGSDGPSLPAYDSINDASAGPVGPLSGYQYTAVFHGQTGTAHHVDVGVDSVGTAHGATDSLAVGVQNQNANGWIYTLTVATATTHAVVNSTGPFTFPVGTFSVLTVSLAGIVGAFDVFLTIAPTISVGVDTNAQFGVAAVPLPATVLLLGSGLLGLGLLGRRKAKKNSEAVAA